MATTFSRTYGGQSERNGSSLNHRRIGNIVTLPKIAFRNPCLFALAVLALTAVSCSKNTPQPDSSSSSIEADRTSAASPDSEESLTHATTTQKPTMRSPAVPHKPAHLSSENDAPIRECTRLIDNVKKRIAEVVSKDTPEERAAAHNKMVESLAEDFKGRSLVFRFPIVDVNARYAEGIIVFDQTQITGVMSLTEHNRKHTPQKFAEISLAEGMRQDMKRNELLRIKKGDVLVLSGNGLFTESDAFSSYRGLVLYAFRSKDADKTYEIGLTPGYKIQIEPGHSQPKVEESPKLSQESDIVAEEPPQDDERQYTIRFCRRLKSRIDKAATLGTEIQREKAIEEAIEASQSEIPSGGLAFEFPIESSKVSRQETTFDTGLATITLRSNASLSEIGQSPVNHELQFSMNKKESGQLQGAKSLIVHGRPVIKASERGNGVSLHGKFNAVSIHATALNKTVEIILSDLSFDLRDSNTVAKDMTTDERTNSSVNDNTDRPKETAGSWNAGRFSLRRLWTAPTVKGPTGIIVIESASAAPKLMVIDGQQDIVELDAAGTERARHKQLVTEGEKVSFLRTLVSHDGKRYFIVGSVGQFHVFDAQWRRTLSYPPSNGLAQILDVLPADIDGDGAPELAVGCARAAGVQAVSLDGRKVWSNRTIQNVAMLAATAPDSSGKRRILCTHEGGTIVPIQMGGIAEESIIFADHAVTHVLSADLSGKGKTEYCGLAVNQSRKHAIVGLTLTGKGGEIAWQQELTGHGEGLPIDAFTTAHLLSGQPGQWLVAFDWSVHIISHDGSWQERFNSGRTVTGMASTNFNGKPVLLLAHPKYLEAFAVEKRP